MIRLGCNKGVLLPSLRLRSFLTKLATILHNPGPGSFSSNLRVHLILEGFFVSVWRFLLSVLLAARHHSVASRLYRLDFLDVLLCCGVCTPYWIHRSLPVSALLLPLPFDCGLGSSAEQVVLTRSWTIFSSCPLTRVTIFTDFGVSIFGFLSCRARASFSFLRRPDVFCVTQEGCYLHTVLLCSLETRRSVHISTATQRTQRAAIFFLSENLPFLLSKLTFKRIR